MPGSSYTECKHFRIILFYLLFNFNNYSVPLGNHAQISAVIFVRMLGRFRIYQDRDHFCKSGKKSSHCSDKNEKNTHYLEFQVKLEVYLIWKKGINSSKKVCVETSCCNLINYGQDHNINTSCSKPVNLLFIYFLQLIYQYFELLLFKVEKSKLVI